MTTELAPALRAPLSPPLRLATKWDAPRLVRFIEAASGGMAPYFWEQKVGAAGARAYGTERMALRAEAGEWMVIDQGDGPLAGLSGYRIPTNPDPIPADTEPMFVPLEELEHAAGGTWYVHVLAALPDERGRGHGTRLLAQAEVEARTTGCTEMSIIVADNNTGARKLYERTGFVEADRRPMVKGGWQNPGTAWILLRRPL
ncbi:MAG: GNAT family N-acetyltransferase [Pseudomonadota bacterium]